MHRFILLLERMHPGFKKKKKKKTQKENTKMQQFAQFKLISQFWLNSRIKGKQLSNWRDFSAKLKQRGSPVAYVQTRWSET